MNARDLPYWKGWWPLIAGLASFFLRWWGFSGNEYATGWDGYFYLVQVKAMIEEGAMHSPDSSPIYLALRGLYGLTGHYVAAFHLMCALLAGTFSALSMVLAQRITNDGWLALVVGAWCLFSPSLTFYAAQFPKNLLGMNALLLLLTFGVRGPWWAGALALGGAFWAHRLTAGLSLIFVAARRLRFDRLLLLAALGGLGLLLAQLFPGMLRIADLERFSGTLQSWPQLQGWAFIELLEPGRMHPAWIAEIVLAHLFLLYWLISWIWERPTPYGWSFFLLVAILLFPFFVMDVRGMGYRFFLSFMLLAPILFALVPHIFPRQLFFVVIAALLAGIAWQGSHYPAETFDPDYAYYDQVTRRAERFLSDKQPELLIGHKGLAELMTYETGIDVLPWLPEYEVDSSRLWRISAGMSSMEFRYLLSKADASRVQEVGIDYHLLPESVWQRFVEAAKRSRDEDLLERVMDWRNPQEMRPGYLRKQGTGIP